MAGIANCGYVGLGEDGCTFLAGLSGEMRLSISNDLLGLVSAILVTSGGLGGGAGSAICGLGGVNGAAIEVEAGAGAGANRNRFMLANAMSSFSSRSLSDFINLKRFRRLSSDPFSNMSKAAGCKAQYAPLPGRSGRRGILTKQSLKERLCLSEFCQRWVFRR